MSVFETFSKAIQWFVSILLGITFFKYNVYFLDLPYTSVWKYVMAAFFVPVYSLAAMPIMTAFGIVDYKSKLLFVMKDSKKRIAIHFGSLIDCLLSGMFWDKDYSFRHIMLGELLKGIHGVVLDIENGVIGKDEIVIGSSYFFNEKTAKKFGFELTDLQSSHKFILYLNYLEILLVHSMSRGRFTLPKFGDFKTVHCTAESLLSKKAYIESIMHRFETNPTIS